MLSTGARPSSPASAAMANSTNGVHRPSLRPLSTLSIRRTRTGTTGLSTVAAPSPASVGATAAARSRSISAGIPGKRTRPSSHPAAIVRGRPTSRRRAIRPRSAVIWRGRTWAASWKRMSARVSSVSRVRASRAVSPRSGRPSDSSAPAATKAIGAVTSMRLSARAVTAKASTSTRKTTIAAVPMAAPSTPGGDAVTPAAGDRWRAAGGRVSGGAGSGRTRTGCGRRPGGCAPWNRRRRTASRRACRRRTSAR